MNAVWALLAHLSQEGISLAVEGGHLAVSPAGKVTAEIRDEILRNRADLMALARVHGAGLLDLFRDPPTWPPVRGRSGVLADPAVIFRAIGRPIGLRDGRGGTLRAVAYDTRTARLRCRVEIIGGESLMLDPEELVPLAGGAPAAAEGG